MSKRRFVAPSRAKVASSCWQLPVFSEFSGQQHWFASALWPSLDEMNAAWRGQRHPHSGAALAFASQDEALLSDGLHYEQRIFEQGRIATREQNWHDLFNAAVWLNQTDVKIALNTRQYRDVVRIGSRERTRAQCALTQFDEAGVIVWVKDHALLPYWDSHDWRGLFLEAADAWRDGRISVSIIGHALLEHALEPGLLLVGKSLVVLDSALDRAAARARMLKAITEGRVLNDPQELRPLPLSGIPGWHPDAGTEAFHASAPCFRPLRPGRRYPDPIA